MKYLLNPWYAHVADMIPLGLRITAHWGAMRRSQMSVAKPERPLIADNDPNALSAYLLYFEAYEYEIQIVEDGAETLVE